MSGVGEVVGALVGWELVEQEAEQARKAAPVIGPSETSGAVTPVSRGPATSVVVRQWACGTDATRRATTFRRRFAAHRLDGLLQSWLAKRPRRHVRGASTGAAWIKQVERLFALPTERQIRRGNASAKETPRSDAPRDQDR